MAIVTRSLVIGAALSPLPVHLQLLQMTDVSGSHLKEREG